MVPPCSCETTRPDLLGRWATVAETELAFHTVRASSCLLSASWPLAPPRGSVSAVSRQGTGHPLSADRGPTATSCCWRTPLGPQTQGPQRWCVPSGLAWCNLPIATFFARSASLVSYPCSAPPQSPFQIPPPLFQPLVDSSASLWGPFATLSFVPLSSSSFFPPFCFARPSHLGDPLLRRRRCALTTLATRRPPSACSSSDHRDLEGGTTQRPTRDPDARPVMTRERELPAPRR